MERIFKITAEGGTKTRNTLCYVRGYAEASKIAGMRESCIIEEITLFDSAEDYTSYSHELIREQAKSKLTPAELRVLGIE